MLNCRKHKERYFISLKYLLFHFHRKLSVKIENRAKKRYGNARIFKTSLYMTMGHFTFTCGNDS